MDMASFLFGGGFTDRTLHSAEARPQASVTFKPAGMPLRFLGGVDVYYVKLEADSFDEKERAIETNSFNISQWAVGPYLTARFSPLSNLAFSAGARFDTAFIDIERLGAKYGIIDVIGTKTYTAFVYEGGIVFSPLSDLKLYTKYSSLFRYPFVDELAQVQGMYDKINDKLKPEEGFNFEIGAAYQLGKIFSINANFFFMELKDEIAVFTDPVTWETSNINLDKTRRFGTNVGATITPLNFLSLDVSYSFVHAFFVTGDNKDKNIPLVPAHKLYGELMVKLPFGLNFGPNIEYTSSAYYGEDYANEGDMMDSRILLGALVRYALNKENREFAVQISAKNLLNTSYASFGTYSWGSYTLYPADGRSINMSLQYRF
jgi:iron complex outermembrane receptor protein